MAAVAVVACCSPTSAARKGNGKVVSAVGTEVLNAAIHKVETVAVKTASTMVKKEAQITVQKTAKVGKRYLGKDVDVFTKLGLEDGMKCSTNKALDLGEQFLGKGYKEIISGSGRYVSSDGKRIFRMGNSDILGKHGGGPHVNFEYLIPNPNKSGKMMVEKNMHVYLIDP